MQAAPAGTFLVDGDIFETSKSFKWLINIRLINN